MLGWGRASTVVALCIVLLGFSSCNKADKDVLVSSNDLVNLQLTGSAPPVSFSPYSGSPLEGLYSMFRFGLANHGSLYSLNEVSSDEFAVTQKGGDWYDGGIWLDVHRHDFKPSSGPIKGSWDLLFTKTIVANQALTQVGLSRSDMLQAKGVRAYNVAVMMDMFGNIPHPVTMMPQLTSAEVFDWLISELTEIIQDELFKNSSINPIYFNYYAALALRHRLYLNAPVYKDGVDTDEMYAKALADAEEIINSGKYSLEAVYADNFKVDNDSSKENIFTIPFDEESFGGMNFAQMNFHYATQLKYNLDAQPWNGYATLEEFYNLYVDQDKNPPVQLEKVWKGKAVAKVDGTKDNRLSNFLVGPQAQLDFAADDDQVLLNYTPEINELSPNSQRQAGARNNKYAVAQFAKADMSNNFVLFRLGEMYLGAAEAAFRLGDTTKALAYINVIRQRANVAPFQTLNAQRILDERGREMYSELIRRQDLIRFNKFNEAWWEKPESESYKNIFPIPQEILNTMPFLQQNPGY